MFDWCAECLCRGLARSKASKLRRLSVSRLAVLRCRARVGPCFDAYSLWLCCVEAGPGVCLPVPMPCRCRRRCLMGVCRCWVPYGRAGCARVVSARVGGCVCPCAAVSARSGAWLPVCVELPGSMPWSCRGSMLVPVRCPCVPVLLPAWAAVALLCPGCPSGWDVYTGALAGCRAAVSTRGSG